MQERIHELDNQLTEIQKKLKEMAQSILWMPCFDYINGKVVPDRDMIKKDIISIYDAFYSNMNWKLIYDVNDFIKNGYNELSLFIELEEKSIFFPPSLTSLLEVKYEEKMRIYDFKKVAELLKSSYEEIKSIEVFYNPYEVKIENFITSDKLKKFNIFNMEEV